MLGIFISSKREVEKFLTSTFNCWECSSTLKQAFLALFTTIESVIHLNALRNRLRVCLFVCLLYVRKSKKKIPPTSGLNLISISGVRMPTWLYFPLCVCVCVFCFLNDIFCMLRCSWAGGDTPRGDWLTAWQW